MTIHYVKCWVNQTTQEVDHVLVSGAPIQNDDIDPGPGYNAEEFEISAPAGTPQIKARAMLGVLEKRGSRIEIKTGVPDLSISARKGSQKHNGDN